MQLIEQSNNITLNFYNQATRSTVTTIIVHTFIKHEQRIVICNLFHRRIHKYTNNYINTEVRNMKMCIYVENMCPFHISD